MQRLARSLVVLLFLLLFLAAPTAARAQSATTGVIAGTVRDTTGAVLPGVTVEAASPALIEKVRTAVTDGQGNYKIVDLRPGTYTVTFSLTGFSIVRREGLELTTGFTANVNADMKVGTLEETVTVTGASPVVDIQNVRQQNVLSRAMLDKVPTGKTLQGFATLTLGATYANAGSQDVGGNQGEGLAGFGVHGSRAADARMTIDGMVFTGLAGQGSASNRQIFVNQVGVQEMTLQTGGISAESETGGVQMNAVPKDGGNNFSVYATGTGAGPALQSDNITDDLRARGLTTTPSVKKIYDLGVGMGGPLRKDRWWFYTAHRWWGAQNYAPGNYFNSTQGTFLGAPNSGVVAYTPDPGQPAYTNPYDEDHTVRVTWQASARNKLSFSNSLQRNCNCYFQVDQNRSPEATTMQNYWPINLTQSTFSHPATSRVLFEAGLTVLYNRFTATRADGVTRQHVAIQELSTGYRYGAKAEATGTKYNLPKGATRNQSNQRVSVSYITGSHALKTGIAVMEGWQNDTTDFNDPPVSYAFRFGVPVSITQFLSPIDGDIRLKANVGVFGQDQWTLGRLTLNMGLRFNYHNAFVPAVHLSQSLFGPALDFEPVTNLPNWTDLDPRLGAAYDIFGNGRTAIKGSLGRYVAIETVGTAEQNTPLARLATNATRTWTDGNGNFVPDCVLTDPAANGECGVLSNRDLGRPILTTTYDEAVLNGYGVRGYNWQGSLSVQHELRPGMALNVGYFRTWFGNFTITENRAVTNADFNPYCVTAPVDARLGAASGQQLCGFYDVTPARFGQVNNFVTHASHFGAQSEVFQGIDVSVNARFGRGGLLQGGISTGRTVTDNCDIVQNNASLALNVPGGGAGARATDAFCHVVNPWSGQTQVKFAGNYPLPFWGLEASATYQNLPGIPIFATLVATNAQIAPTLGRNLAQGAAGTATVALIEPYSLFEDRISQLDLRFIKNLRIGPARVQGMIDVYNLLNAGSILTENAAYGPTWLRPTAILGGRLFKFGAQVEF